MIEFEQVFKRYETTGAQVFNGCSALIEKGEFVLLTGESGAGKTTFIRLILKETEPDGGRIRVMGQDLSTILPKQIPRYRRRLGVVFQEFYLIPDRTVYENVELARQIAGGSRKSSRTVIASLFSLLGIADLHRKYPRELSGGEKQKVCLARALVNYPSILLADEPTGNLSPAESEELMRLFALVHRQGITVVVATHDKRSAEGLACREMRLRGGVQDGQDAGTMSDGQ